MIPFEQHSSPSGSREISSRSGIRSRGGGQPPPFPTGIFSGSSGGSGNSPSSASAGNMGFDLGATLDLGASLSGRGDRISSLDELSADKLLKIKRGMWFIIRGQNIHTMDGVRDFFAEVKEEMLRQLKRDAATAYGDTASMVESMVTNSIDFMEAGSSMNSSSGNNMKNMNSNSSGDGNTASSSNIFSPGASDANVFNALNNASSSSNFSNNSGTSPTVKASSASRAAEMQQQQEQEEEKQREQREQREKEQEKQKEKEQEEESHQLEIKREKEQQQILLKSRTVLEHAIENDDQAQETRITDVMEDWADTVSMLIICSQIFVLFATLIRVGFNLPISLASIVTDKLFGDLVALISLLYRCFAPFKVHGYWHFDWKSRFWKYFKSGAFFLDFIAIFPLDLIALGLGFNCALFRPDRCDLIGAHWQLNRVLQCRGMFTNFGSVAETLFLRRGLHPILGRVAEVLLFMICLTHVVACIFNFILTRGDKSGLDEYFEPGFEDTSATFQYFMVLDWAIKSLVGLSPRGTSFPPSGLDQAFVIVVTIMGVGVFTNYIATIKLYFDRDCPEKTHSQVVDETIDMVQYMHLSDGFRDECLDYFNHMFKARFHMSGMRDFEDDLAGGLSRKMRFVVGRELVSKIPLLASLSRNEPFIVSLMQRIEPLVLPPDTVIFKKDEAGSTMLVIVKGFVDVLSDTGVKIVTLGAGAFFGEVALLMETPRTATVKSCGAFVNVLSLDRRQMSELIMLFPEIGPILMREMAKRMHELRAKQNKK